MNVAVIGAGMAGLTIAKLLNDEHRVIIFDKGRSVGGRMSHRRHNSFEFDHGAQYITVRDRRFRAFLHKFCEKSAFAPWPARFASIENGKITAAKVWHEDHFVGLPTMNGLTKSLAQGLNVLTSTAVKHLIKENHQWQLFDKDDHYLGTFDRVILTAPAAQTHALLPNHCCFKSEMDKKIMQGCFTLMLGFEKNPITEFDAAHVKDDIISWISVNSSKPGRKMSPSVVINSTNRWADHHLENDLEDVKSYLLTEARRLLPIPLQPSHVDIQRWRYANITPQQGPQAYFDANENLAACGDWCIKGRVESAFLSALSLFEQMNILRP